MLRFVSADEEIKCGSSFSPATQSALGEYWKKPREKAAAKGLFRELTLEAAWLPSDGDEGMGMTRFKGEITLALPGPTIRSMSKKSFFLLKPKFSYTGIDWKRDTAFPNSLYEAGLNLTWMQPLNDRWTFLAGATPQWASDGKESSQSMRCSALLGFSWKPNRYWDVRFGVSYLDRNDDLNFLPFGGVIWKPRACLKI